MAKAPTEHEIIFHAHVHTIYSDGSGTHAEVLRAALRAGVDVLQFTDHNVWVQGVEGYYQAEGRRVLALVGEELHHRSAQARGNHLLAFGVRRELAGYAHDPQQLINEVRRSDGLAFLAHPIDPAVPYLGEGDFSWTRWDVSGYHGIELWNALSEFKTRLRTRLHALYYLFNFPRVAVAPLPQTLQLWDRLLQEGRPVVAISGSDAHQLPVRLGPWTVRVFPYEKHFRAINTHLLLDEPLRGDVEHDRALVYRALAAGHAFIANDWLGSARGFRFRAHGRFGQAIMGDEVHLGRGLTLKMRLPERARIRLLRDGQVLHTWDRAEVFSYPIRQRGVYRVEVYREAWGQMRGWIFSNPIYVR
ncbi:MAG: CehA/McbA family metallohydrolase [Chloroflexi bacterium]|nr:CehA/McbA family metallohydrolase [Chloroflexota bacterium]